MKERDEFRDLVVDGRNVKMDRMEIRCEGTEKLPLAQNRNLRVPWQVGNLLATSMNIRSSKKEFRSSSYWSSQLMSEVTKKPLVCLQILKFAWQFRVFCPNTDTLFQSQKVITFFGRRAIYRVSSQVVWRRLITLQNKTIRLCVYVLWTAASKFDTGLRRFVVGSMTSLSAPILKSGGHNIFFPFPIHPTVLCYEVTSKAITLQVWTGP